MIGHGHKKNVGIRLKIKNTKKLKCEKENIFF